ncbi:MAG: GNAT family N-acetyltransferase [Actinobacteria bacterium]|nr:GNAT family N-acetyltransferase [Actinomycetota bacterium]MBI3687783.1 GNAT family N-acetyltransferase [Actinomycetota bacterium]
MLIAELDPAGITEADQDAWCELALACQRVDLPTDPTPTRRALLGRLQPRGDEQIRSWVARDNGGFAGAIVLALFTGANAHLAVCRLEVRPSERRRGVGRVLYDRAAVAAKAAGRTALVADCRVWGPGAGFAAELGARPVLTDLRSLLRLSEVDDAAMRSWASGGRARTDGCSLVRWVHRCPDELVEQFLLVRTGMDDTPHGELELRPERPSVVELRKIELNAARRGEILYAVAVREEATGRLTAYTSVHVSAGMPWGAVGSTTVLPTYRGRGFGLWVKADMVRWLAVAQPQLTGYVTGNDAENLHMRRINEAMGYHVLDSWQAWQLDL